MSKYKLIGYRKGKSETKNLDTASMADAWASEFADRGFKDITIERDGIPIKVEDLPAYAREENSEH